jgi:uncharacterized membrane protein YwaF
MNIYVFNGVWWSLLAAIVAVCLLLWLIFRRRSERVRSRVILIICLLNFLLFLLYKYWLSQDAVYLQENGFASFSIWLELPLQLCNINLLLIPLALLLRREGLFVFCSYGAVIGAFMAIASPATSFSGDLLQVHNIGYYGTHALLIVCGASLITLRFVRPRQRDVLWLLFILLLTTGIIHGINTLMRQTLHVDANYFYTYGPDGSFILESLYQLLPMPLAYLFLILPVLAPFLVLLTALINLPARLRRARR